MQMRGEQPCGVGGIDQQLGVIAEEQPCIAEKGLGRPLAVRVSGALSVKLQWSFAAPRTRGSCRRQRVPRRAEGGHIAVAGDGNRPVLAIPGEAAGRPCACPVTVIAERIAIGIVGDRTAADRGWRMGPVLQRRGPVMICLDGHQLNALSP